MCFFNRNSRRTRIPTPWLTALVGVSSLAMLSACGETKDDSPSCADGATQTIACGEDGKGTQAQICVDGAWTHDGDCQQTTGECTDGATQTIPCGDDDEGTQAQVCKDGAWTDDGACEAPADTCVNGEIQVVACGDNDEHEQTLKCVNGEWTEDSECAAPVAECTDGDTDTLACGDNDELIQNLLCVNERWTADGGCTNPNAECDTGDSQVVDCGYNDRGEQAQTCQDGRWTNLGGCSDDDECKDGANRNVDCGTNGLQAQVCTTGAWANDGACVEFCVDGDTDTTSCGLNDNGTQNLVCNDGDWLNDGACDDPDECVLSERRRTTCSADGLYGDRQESCRQTDNGTRWEAEASCTANSISMKLEHACAVRNDGKIDCWGRNANGQLGDGTTTRRATPVTVKNITNAQQVAVGNEFSCALTTEGDVYCWGSNSNGKLGNNSTTSSTTPVKVNKLSNVRSIAVGSAHTCAIDDNWEAHCWGQNNQGQLGIDSTNDRWEPTKVLNLPQVSKVIAGYETTCALVRLDGFYIFLEPQEAYCWGSNRDNAAGVQGNNPVDNYTVPRKITTHKFLDISLARSAFCGTIMPLGEQNKSRREVYCIGGKENIWNPEQGDGDGYAGIYRTFHALGVSVNYINTGISNFIYPRLFASTSPLGMADNVCALMTHSNEPICWGANRFSSLARGYAAKGNDDSDPATPKVMNRSAFIQIAGHPMEIGTPVSNARALAVGYDSICIINNAGKVECSGAMSSSALGYINTVGPKPD